MTLAEKYVKDVLSGKIKTGEYIRQSCEHFDSWKDRKDVYFDVELANKIIKFCETILRFWEGQWRDKPAHIYPWQAFIIQNIFCWKYVDTNLRVIRSAYIEIARKNGKTTLAAIISFIHIFLDEDLTPQILVGANNEDQAKICTDTVAQIWQISPRLAAMIKSREAVVRRYGPRARSVSFKFGKKNGYIEAMSKEVKSKDGFNPSLGVIDEFHEAKDDALLNVIASGQAARKEPLLVVITTAGFNKFGVCYQRLRKSAINVLSGKSDIDTQFSAIYELDDSDDWQDAKAWVKSNPMINHVDTIKPYLQDQCKKAISEGSTTQVNFQTKNLNQWTDTASVWIQDALWVANHDPKLSKQDLEGLTAFGGLDLAQTRDLNCFSLFFPEVPIWGTDKKAVLLWAWIPEKNVKYRTRNYQEYVSGGYMRTMPGDSVDQRIILADIEELTKRYDVLRLHYDKYYANMFQVYLSELNIATINPVGMASYFMNETMNMMERLVAKKQIEHFGNPIYRWSLANLEPTYDKNGHLYPNKSNPENKIDPTVSKLLSIDAWMADMQEEKQDIDLMIL